METRHDTSDHVLCAISAAYRGLPRPLVQNSPCTLSHQRFWGLTALGAALPFRRYHRAFSPIGGVSLRTNLGFLRAAQGGASHRLRGGASRLAPIDHRASASFSKAGRTVGTWPQRQPTRARSMQYRSTHQPLDWAVGTRF